MWELISTIIGVVSGIVLMIIKAAIFKDRQATLIKAMDKKLITLNTLVNDTLLEITELEKKIENHNERINSITRDHTHLEDSLEKLNETMNENSHMLSALRATLTGLQEMIQNIIAGNLKIRV